MANIPAAISNAPMTLPEERACGGAPNKPKWSMASDIRILAVMVRPARAPAPTLSTKEQAGDHRKGADHPPSGAHQGLFAKPSAVGSGRG
jgi:hypothetical protein